MECMKFQCSSCGACCRRAGQLGLMPQREDGACLYLDENNRCKIYETRPDICRVDVMAERNRKSLNLTKKAYFKLANQVCNSWIKEDGMDESYLINVEAYGPDTV